MFFPYRIESDEERRPVVTYVLIGINVVLFGVYQFLPGKEALLIFDKFGFVPEQASVLTVVTYMFLHANWLHIVGNMYFLWLFGRALESAMGSIRFLALYIVSGVVAVLAHSVFTPPEVADVTCNGASGAISGIMGGFIVVLPRVSVECVLMLGLTPTTMVRPPAVVVLGAWFAIQLFEQWVVRGQGSTAVAYGAHIGGFLFGWAAMGIARTIHAAAAEWRKLVRLARLRGMAALINEGNAPTGEAMRDPDAQRMLYLRTGTAPADPANLSDWMAAMHPDDDAGVTASVVFRSSMEGNPDSLEARMTAKGADAISRLGHPSVALGCLFDRLETAEDESAQYLLCGIGTMLLKDMNRRDEAIKCM